MIKLKVFWQWALIVVALYISLWLSHVFFHTKITWRADTITIIIISIALPITLILTEFVTLRLIHHFQERAKYPENLPTLIKTMVDRAASVIMVITVYATYQLVHGMALTWDIWIAMFVGVAIVMVFIIPSDLAKYRRHHRTTGR